MSDCGHSGCQGPLDHSKVEQIVSEHGQQVVGIMDDPQFCYTIGNAGLGLPELLIIGNLRTDLAMTVLNILGARQRMNGVALEEGLHDIEFTYPLKLVKAPEYAKEQYTIQAGQHIGREDYEVLQVLICDEAGLFPGDEGCDPKYAELELK